MAALLGADMDAGAGDLRRGRPGPGRPGETEVVRARQRQRRRSGRDLRPSRARSSARSRSPRRKGIRRAMLLPVSAPFHCALMAPAADAMAEAFEQTPPKAPLRAAGRQCLGPRKPIRPRSADLLVRAGHRHGALAGMRAGDDRAGRRQLHRAWRRQGADRPGQAYRAGCITALAAGTPAEIEALLKSSDEGRSGMFRLDGKAALVTGASGGIGAAIARALHAQGANVVLSGTRRDRAGGTGGPNSASAPLSAPPICATPETRRADRSGGKSRRPAAYPGQQRRDDPRHAGAADVRSRTGRRCWTST